MLNLAFTIVLKRSQNLNLTRLSNRRIHFGCLAALYEQVPTPAKGFSILGQSTERYFIYQNGWRIKVLVTQVFPLI